MKLKYYLRGLGLGIIVTAVIMSFVRQPEKLTDAQIKLRALELGMVEESVLSDLQKKEDGSLEDEKTPLDDVLMSGGEGVIGDDIEIEESAEIEENVQTDDLEKDDNEEEAEIKNDSKDEGDAITKNNSKDESDLEINNNSKVENNPEVETNVELVNDVEVENSSTQDESVEIKKPVTDIEIANMEKEPLTNEMTENYVIITIESGNGSETVSRRLYNAGLVDSASAYNKYLVDNGYSRILKAGNHEIPEGATEEEMAKILCGMK